MNTALLGAAVVRLREQKGLSRKALARRADVDESILCRIETGQRDARLEVAIAIAEALGCSLDDLAG